VHWDGRSPSLRGGIVGAFRGESEKDSVPHIHIILRFFLFIEEKVFRLGDLEDAAR